MDYRIPRLPYRHVLGIVFCNCGRGSTEPKLFWNSSGNILVRNGNCASSGTVLEFRCRRLDEPRSEVEFGAQSEIFMKA